PILRDGRVDRGRLRAWLTAHRTAITATLDRALAQGPAARCAVLRERAALSLLGDCWLDTVSQPATQPAVIVNILFGQRWNLLGQGCPARSCAALRRRSLETAGIFLPPITDAGFAAAAGTGRTTALQAAFLLSLSRYPASYLPELVGIHAAYHALQLDDHLTALAPVVSAEAALGALDAYLDRLDGETASECLARRLVDAIRVFVGLEQAQAEMLAELAQRMAGRSLDVQVAAIVRRHARFAGKQHGRIRIGGKLLSDRFAEADLDLTAFLQDFKQSGYLRADGKGGCRFIDATKSGGAMFGIFSEEEARILNAWAERAQQTIDVPVFLAPDGPDEMFADAWLTGIRNRPARHIVFEATPALDDRTLFYRLVNFENFPNSLRIALARAQEGLVRAELLYEKGALGRYTDARFFDYSPEALLSRVESIYWCKLVDPYVPLTDIPPREEVVFGQKIFALGSLIDGSWAFRSGSTGRYERIADATLFGIYADEMGLGDIQKNHITLIHRVLSNLGLNLPHIRDESFIDQDEIPDNFYAFPLNQLSLGLFPDRFYPEILGYNLGIEMFGLGELRLHEMQKLKHWGFDPIYEKVHLSIDNLSAGHAQQAVTIIRAHLDDTERRYGTAASAIEWRRIWNGYAAFAYFTEGGTLDAPPAAMAEDYSVLSL
ncbi:MAG: iron-containing redox enzyme family protein, partial [Aliidongia sp.]